MSTELTSLCMPQIHDRPVQFLGVCLIFLRPIRIPFFPQLDLGSIKSTSNFTRPLKIAEITKRSFHAESNIIGGRPGRPNDLAYVYLIEISLSFSFYFILFVAGRSPKNVDHCPSANGKEEPSFAA